MVLHIAGKKEAALMKIEMSFSLTYKIAYVRRQGSLSDVAYSGAHPIKHSDKH